MPTDISFPSQTQYFMKKQKGKRGFFKQYHQRKCVNFLSFFYICLLLLCMRYALFLFSSLLSYILLYKVGQKYQYFFTEECKEKPTDLFAPLCISLSIFSEYVPPANLCLSRPDCYFHAMLFSLKKKDKKLCFPFHPHHLVSRDLHE